MTVCFPRVLTTGVIKKCSYKRETTAKFSLLAPCHPDISSRLFVSVRVITFTSHCVQRCTSFFFFFCGSTYVPYELKCNNMSQCDVTEAGVPLNSPAFLSWRKLQLSRAKLKASSKTSALLSGFAMVAMVEMQISDDSKVPEGMLVAFAVCTTLLVAVHMLALMISTCILPNIDAVCNLHSVSLVHEAPHERLHWYIETAWAFSTLLGLLLFLAEIAILCWVKFYDISKYAAWSAVIMLIPVLVIFLAFAIHFYQSMVAHKYEVTVSGIRQLELLKEQIEAGDLERTNGLLLNTPGTQIV
uniref:Calcium release-activated calcium channel protein 1 n=3 Tax=Aphidini TaxID=33387 RepID=A0A2S2PM48_SCHGA